VGQGEVFTDQMNLLLPDYSVHNYGLNGVGTVIEYLLFEQEVKPLVRPGDILLLMFCNNDFADNVERGKVHAEAVNGQVEIIHQNKPIKSSAAQYLKNHSYLWNYLSYRFDLYKLVRASRQQQDEILGRVIEASDERFITTRYFLGRLDKECKALKARFVVAHIPAQTDLKEGLANRPNKAANEQAYGNTLSAIVNSLHLETVELLPGFLARKAKTGQALTFTLDEHWTSAGHQAAAEVLSEYLTSHPGGNGAQ
jgi:hypothetical protein